MVDEQEILRRQRAAAAELKAKQQAEARQKRMDELKAEREKRMAEKAAERAASDPMKDPTNRPEAPQLDDGYIRYYSWVGGVNTGSWKLYKEKVDSPKAASAEARSTAGETQATFSSALGANTVLTSSPGTDANASANADANAGAGKQSLPPGFTAGAFPKELEQYFGAPPENIMGWKLTEYTNAAGEKYYKLSISQKGAYGNALYGSSEFGAPIAKDASGKWILFQGDYSGAAVSGDGDKTGYRTINGILYFNDIPFSGTYNGQTYENGKVKTVSSNNNTGYQVVDGKLYFNGQLFTGSFSGQTYENGTVKATTVANSNVMTASQEDVYSIMVARLNQYNLGALAPLIRDLAIKGATEATIMLQLSEEPLYKERFKANEARKQKGLSVLTPSQYLSLEDDYRQVLRAYGLTQFDNDAYVSQFLANDVSVSELSNRVVTAVQRVRNADPAISSMLKNLYGIGQNDLVAYVLDPQQQFQKIERQIAASEISVAAARQGFDIGATVAEQLAAQGISQAEAQRGYSTIADILPTAEKLSDIYGGVEEQYRLPEAEQEVFNQLASAQRKRQRLVSRETAAFSGASGLGRTSLTKATGGQF